MKNKKLSPGAHKISLELLNIHEKEKLELLNWVLEMMIEGDREWAYYNPTVILAWKLFNMKTKDIMILRARWKGYGPMMRTLDILISPSLYSLPFNSLMDSIFQIPINVHSLLTGVSEYSRKATQKSTHLMPIRKC